MALDVKIKTNAKHLEKRYARLKSKFPNIIDKGLLQAGFQLLDIIRTKTKKGIDFNDKRFAAYSRGYIKRLEREGKPTKVDLFYSGRMLSALTPSAKTVKRTGKHKITLGFSNAEMRTRALFNQVMMGDKNREFFGFNTRTENIIKKQFNRFVQKEFRKMRI